MFLVLFYEKNLYLMVVTSFTQELYSEQTNQNKTQRHEKIVLLLSSYWLFGYGIGATRQALKRN